MGLPTQRAPSDHPNTMFHLNVKSNGQVFHVHFLLPDDCPRPEHQYSRVWNVSHAAMPQEDHDQGAVAHDAHYEDDGEDNGHYVRFGPLRDGRVAAFTFAGRIVVVGEIHGCDPVHRPLCRLAPPDGQLWNEGNSQ